jgi:hypothetical protein
MRKGWTREQMDRLYPTADLRRRHRAWVMLCCQARFRGEECTITEQEFFDIWAPYWSQRGRRSDQMTMTRIDPELPWTRANVEILTRAEHLKREKNFWKSRL